MLFKNENYLNIPKLFTSNWKQNHKCVWKDITAPLKCSVSTCPHDILNSISNNKKIPIICIWRNNGQGRSLNYIE